MPKVADDGKEDGYDQSCIDSRAGELRQMEGLALQETAVADDSVDRGERCEQRGECVEAEGFFELTMEKRGEGTGGSATRALQVRYR
jgi:hypothetical protein